MKCKSLTVLVLLPIFINIHIVMAQKNPGYQHSANRLRREASLAKKFRPFEIELNSSTDVNNRYTDVSVSAVFISPGGTELAVDGFWDGGTRWKIRMMPTEIGHWRYMTTSNDSQLHRISGEFDCVDSEHPGMLTVSQKYPYSFELGEAGPFFWMGETSWCLMSDAVPFDGTFQSYIDARLKQNFNGIHFVLGTGGLPVGTQNPVNEGGALWVSLEEQRINPAFFHWVDKRFAYLDSVGMAIGFFITWAQHYDAFTMEEYKRFERYLVARYAAFPLLYWVIVGEFDEAESIDEFEQHAAVFQAHDPYGHLISIHPGHSDPENIGTNRIFGAAPWMSFIMHQLPYFAENDTPADINRYVREDRIFGKPVVNIEFGYESMDYYGEIFSADDVRKFVWAIVLGGGFPSYGHNNTIRGVDLNATRSQGAAYMQILHDFFQNISWWQMTPDNSKVSAGYCLTDRSSEYILYLPDSAVVTVDLTGGTDLLHNCWMNPKNGERRSVQAVQAGTSQTFISPFEDDAVLHLWSASNDIEPPVKNPDVGGGDQLPGSFILYQNYPNPFNSSTTIRYRLSHKAKVALKILNLSGQQVCTLEDTVRRAGVYAVEWDGNNEAGSPVATAAYLCQLEIRTDEISPRRIVRVRKILFEK
ncbi:DUF4038 domain-containing protein [candidate division KSB1 bacterium]|nr:DUF4038 domain-containing protein [candidate division KSB1 bacterium]